MDPFLASTATNSSLPTSPESDCQQLPSVSVLSSDAPTINKRRNSAGQRHVTLLSNDLPHHTHQHPVTHQHHPHMSRAHLQIATLDGGECNRLLVLKVGTSTILDTSTANFSLSNLGKFVDAISNLKEQGYQVVLVSSGAVGAGVIHLKLKERPATLQGKQAASAVGQCRMMRLYEDLFAIREQKVAQLIVTRADLMDRTRYMNFKNTLKELLRLGVLPIINENDSIATVQLRFGDNDTLAAYVAVSLGAQWLFLLTDVDCLYTANPRIHPNARPIPYVGHLDDIYGLLDQKESSGTAWGSGGMRTKIIAAKIATATGIHTALCHGEHPGRILDVIRFTETFAQTPDQWGCVLAAWKERMTSSHQDMSLRLSASMKALKRDPSMNQINGLQHHHSHGNLKALQNSPLIPTKNENATLEVEGAHGDVHLIGSIGRDAELLTVQNLAEMPYLATIFAALECTQNIRDQRRWILSLPVRGRLYVDGGAARAIVEGKKSLFAAGIQAVEGSFYEGEVAAIYISRQTELSLPSTAPPTPRGGIKSPFSKGKKSTEKLLQPSMKERKKSSPCLAPASPVDDLDDQGELARCLSNFTSIELDLIKGLRSEKFLSVLGYETEPEVAHRQNIIFVNPCSVFGCNADCSHLSHEEH